MGCVADAASTSPRQGFCGTSFLARGAKAGTVISSFRGSSGLRRIGRTVMFRFFGAWEHAARG